MSLKTPVTQDRVLPEPGIHVARCVAVIDQGSQQTAWGSKPTILIGWELPNEPTYEWEGEERTAMIWNSYTASMSAKANLRKMLEGWRGKPYSREELEQFHLKGIVGKPCMVSLIHSEDGQYANISSVSAIRQDTQCPPQQTPSIIFDLDDPDWDLFRTFSEKMQKKITNTPEYQEVRSGPTEDHGQDDQHREEDEIPF